MPYYNPFPSRISVPIPKSLFQPQISYPAIQPSIIVPFLSTYLVHQCIVRLIYNKQICF